MNFLWLSEGDPPTHGSATSKELILQGTEGVISKDAKVK